MTTDQRTSAGLAGFSVRTRITVAVAVLTGLALAGAGLVVYALESARIDRAAAAQVEQVLAEFAGMGSRNDPETGRELNNVRRLIQVFLEQNVPGDNELLVGYWDGEPKRVQGDEERRQLLDDAGFLRTVSERSDSGGTQNLDTRWGEVAVTVQPVRDSTTQGAFVVALFLDGERAALAETIKTYAIVSLLSLGVITGVAAWQAGRLLNPVRTLRETAQQITDTDLSRRIPETGNDDITALTRTFNEMLARLENAFIGQREFLDDAGHELKTPLTVIRGHMELIDSTDPVDVEETRALLLDEIDRMSRLVSDLIMLAKADRPDFVRPSPVDIGALTQTVLDKCRALGAREWVLDERAELVADVDEQRITQAILQLAQNAVEHTRSSDAVAVGSRLDIEQGLSLWVRDSGPGVPDEDKERIFDRFARGGVREGDEGFGLGLSIVKAIAVAHGGSVTVEDADPPGARFVLTLPAPGRDDSWPGY